MVPLDALSPPPAKPLFFFLTPLVRIQALLDQAASHVQDAQWDGAPPPPPSTPPPTTRGRTHGTWEVHDRTLFMCLRNCRGQAPRLPRSVPFRRVNQHCLIASVSSPVHGSLCAADCTAVAADSPGAWQCRPSGNFSRKQHACCRHSLEVVRRRAWYAACVADLRFILKRIQGPPNDLKANLQSATAGAGAAGWGLGPPRPEVCRAPPPADTAALLALKCSLALACWVLPPVCRSR